jgi:hypothetical protein
MSEKNNYKLLDGNIINIKVKNVKFQINGIVQNEYSTLLKDLNVKLKFSWENNFRAVKTAENGIFIFSSEIKMQEHIAFELLIDEKEYKKYEKNLKIDTVTLFSDDWNLWVYSIENPIILKLANTIYNDISLNFSNKFQKVTLQVNIII